MNKRGEYTMEKFKICSKCGAKIEADARFCTKCGLKITGEDFNQTNTMQGLPDDSKFCSGCGASINSNINEPAKKSKKKPLIICISILVLILIIVIVALAINNGCGGSGTATGKNQKPSVTEKTDSKENKIDNKNDTETKSSQENTENISQDNVKQDAESKTGIVDVSGDTNDANAVKLYQNEVKSGKCALFYINGSDIPLCAYKSSDGKKEILLVYNKNNSSIDVFDMGDDTKIYYDNDRVMFKYTSVRDDCTDYKVDVYSIIGEVGGYGNTFGPEGYAIDKRISGNGEVTYSSGQDVCDEAWYNDNIKVLDNMKTVDYKYDSISDAYAAIDKKEIYIRKALAAYSEAAAGKDCTVTYLMEKSEIPVCIYETTVGEQHLLAYINGELVDIFAASRGGTVNYNKKTSILRMDSEYGNSESESHYFEYYQVTDKGIEHLTDAFIYNKYKDDGNGGTEACDFEYSIGDYNGNDEKLTEDEFNKSLEKYGDSADFSKIYCGYMGVYYAYSDLLAGKDTELSWKKSYMGGLNSINDKCISTVLQDVNNDGIPEVFCEWDEGSVSYTMDYIDKNGNVKQLFYVSSIGLSTADGYVKISGGHSGIEFDTVYKYNNSTGDYDIAFDGVSQMKDDGNGHSGITYTVNDKQCSESEYNEALQQLVQKISFTDINFETMGRSESPRDSIKVYHQAEK